jgi:hypothetical protein
VCADIQGRTIENNAWVVVRPGSRAVALLILG